MGLRGDSGDKANELNCLGSKGGRGSTGTSHNRGDLELGNENLVLGLNSYDLDDLGLGLFSDD